MLTPIGRMLAFHDMSDEANLVSSQDRSPKYPRLTLEEAIAKVKHVHRQAGKSFIPVETLATALGYKNAGAGGTIIVVSTLHQYGLISRGTDKKYSVSPLAIRILHPTGDQQLVASLQQSALTPPIFAQIRQTLHECSEQVLASHLVQSRFTPDGAAKAAAIYKKNSEFAKLDLADYSRTNDAPSDQEPMTAVAQTKNLTEESPVFASRTQPKAQTRGSNLSLPLGNGDFVEIPRMSEDDYDLFVETLKLWKKKLVLQPSPRENFPFMVMWKNKDFDKIVKIVGVMGDQNGEKFYQSEDGTGIPASELFPDRP